jgi:1-acyl-sn-glycerol-3-phosphate acyltransferase
MNKIFRGVVYFVKVILTSIGYITYFLAIVGFLVIGLPFSFLFVLNPGLMRGVMYAVLKGYTYFLTRLWLPALGIYRVSSVSDYDSPALRGSIIVANHRGRLDALLLLSMLPPTAVVIKQKYARIPMYSSFVKHLDFVNIDPDSLSSLGAAIEKSRRVLTQGKCLLVFPEGTRAKTGRLLPFKPFPFRIALETGAPIAPVLIHSGLPFMARCKGSIFPRRMFDYKVRFLSPCRPDAVRETASGFADRVRRIMGNELAVLDKGSYWDQSLRKEI